MNQYRFIGYNQVLIVSSGGVYSTMKVYSPWVPSGGISYAWVMLPGSGANHWAQFGPYEVVGGTRHNTAQYADGGAPVQFDFAADAIGSSHTFTVLYDPSSKYFTWQHVGNSVLHRQLTSYVPMGAQISEETNYADV